jgi:hypothetical protein
MKTFLACTFAFTCIISFTHFLILMTSELPWTLFNHVHAVGVMGIFLFSLLGMYALTEIKPRGATKL